MRPRSLSFIAENAFSFKASMTSYFCFLSFKSFPSASAAISIISFGYRALLENLKILPILEIGLANKLVSAILIPLSPNAWEMVMRSLTFSNIGSQTTSLYVEFRTSLSMLYPLFFFLRLTSSSRTNSLYVLRSSSLPKLNMEPSYVRSPYFFGSWSLLGSL